ncbi:putative acyl-CoA thioesterase YneP [Weizmannia acidilactici]|uniref:Acyl-CoA thioesterase YneP n=1 Tax=Weizmannia acidilactici TaxID=2607726 RepID=A0A5J4JII0_9BACI|nr:thioesterase family protein [Weizmannia acidilactici]GER67823.1 putative acyl-CoA thioesterase YneP [Weizmannia acidilactici]GER70268.1 putative acyl-CoA thioesterase YneP [Weizmannia acidilactici]GER74880.1 putative acyl-CoA thioesterase YneP [Weizmannia acidilactici]
MQVSEAKIHVRYAETDQMGVVYHANYLVWMEVGRTKLIEDLGFRYADMEKDGIISPVIDIQVSYKKPVRYGETATVKTWIDHYDGLRVHYGYEIYTGNGDLAVTGVSKHVCVKKDTFRPISIRRVYPDWHEAYEKAKKS